MYSCNSNTAARDGKSNASLTTINSQDGLDDIFAKLNIRMPGYLDNFNNSQNSNDDDNGGESTKENLNVPPRLWEGTPKRTIKFLHDPDLDSTPFTYYKTTYEGEGGRHSRNYYKGSKDHGIMSDSNSTTTASSSSSNNDNHTATAVTNTESACRTYTVNEDGDDTFGLGAFNEMFITDSDLEVAKSKLEYEKSRLEVQTDIMSSLLPFEYNDADLGIPVETDSSTTRLADDCCDCSLFFNQYQIGFKGLLIFPNVNSDQTAISLSSLRWKGKLFDGDTMKQYAFPESQLADLRIKDVDDELNNCCYLFVTLSSSSSSSGQIFLQFEVKREDGMPSKLSALKDRLHVANLSGHQLPTLNSLCFQSSDSTAEKSQIINAESSSECQICFNGLPECKLDRCEHWMCSECLATLMNTYNSSFRCPWCRR